MKKVNVKLGSVKVMLTKEEMKKISGGYNVCCCIGGTYGYLDPCTHSSSGGIGQTDCASFCALTGATGALWDANSLCNHWGQC
jgi:hypothetical protein